MPDWREHFPEAYCMDDPYIEEIVTTDDWITDYRYNAEHLGLSVAAGEAAARQLEAQRLDFELETLVRWWSL
jgi:hypothetical protein